MLGQCVANMPDESVGQDASLRNAEEIMLRWRDFIIYLATLVASVLEPMRFDACLREICAVSVDGLPDKSCWRRALNYVTLTAARFQFIRLLVLPVDLHDQCIGKGTAFQTAPVPISVKTVHYMIWADSTLAAKPNKADGVKKKPRSTMVPDYLKTIKLHNIQAKMTHCGGKLVDMLKWVEDLPAVGPQSCLFVGVCPFNDFPKGANNVIYHLPDEFFANLNRFIERLNALFPKSVLISGGTGKTWSVQDTVFDIHAARVRERLRQGSTLVVNPTDLFDTLPERDQETWHFRCLSHCDRLWNRNLTESTLLNLENIISHVVLIAHHLIESNVAISSRGDRNWIADMKPKSASAHLTLAIQYDPREDVLPLSYSRRANASGNGTVDLQSLRSFGIVPALLRGRVLKARIQRADECHILAEVADNASWHWASLRKARSSKWNYDLRAPLPHGVRMRTC